MKDHYTAATLELLRAGHDPKATLANLRRAMEARGHLRLYPRVLKALHAQLRFKREADVPTVWVARPELSNDEKERIATSLAAIDAPAEYRTKVNDALVGGHIARYGNTIIDRSYRQALLKLYRSVRA